VTRRQRSATPVLREREIERQCDQLIDRMGGRIVRHSAPEQVRVTMGIPDREYFVSGERIRMELKADDERLTEEQAALLYADHHARGIVCCGGLAELRLLLVVLKRSGRDEAQALGHRFVQLWAAKGFRRRKAA
jgi:hypothetical protein